MMRGLVPRGGGLALRLCVVGGVLCVVCVCSAAARRTILGTVGGFLVCVAFPAKSGEVVEKPDENELTIIRELASYIPI